MGKRIGAFASVLAALAVITLHGQEPAPPAATAYDVGVYQFGNTTTPFRYNRVALSQITCDLPAVEGVTGATNPKAFAWDDPNRPGRMCRVVVDGVMSTLPDGTYQPLVRAAAFGDNGLENNVSNWIVSPTTFVRDDGLVDPTDPGHVPCSWSVTPGTWNPPAAGGDITFDVQPNHEAGCDLVTPGALPAWVTITVKPSIPGSGGRMPVQAWAAANPGAARVGLLALNSAVVMITQGSAGVDPPPAPPCAADAVSVLVGDWSRNVSLGAFGRVTYNLQLSAAPVTTLVVKFNGAETDRVTGSDLRKIAGSYFKVPSTRGSYALSVEGQTAAGCTGGATRPMSVNVR